MRDENMSYTVKSSERLRKSGSEAETKALLYLMNFRPDSDDIYYFVVDLNFRSIITISNLKKLGLYSNFADLAMDLY